MQRQFSIALCTCAACLIVIPLPTQAQPAKPSTKTADPFPAGSVWVNENSTMTLTILKRDGETFRGKLVAGESVDRSFTGTIKDGKVSWLAKDVEAVKGGPGGDNTGIISGDRIDFTYRTDAGKGAFTLLRSADITMKNGGGGPSSERGSTQQSNRPRGVSRRAARGMPSEDSAGALVTVDFRKQVADVKSMSGFLHSITSTEPPDRLIEPLRPALWRTAPGAQYGFERVAKMKIPMILVLSDTWGYENDKTPIRNYAKWEAHVRDVARTMSRYEFVRDNDYDLVWDIWNEPDQHEMFWKGTEAEFFETFGRGAKGLREGLGPQTKISGPSLTKYDVPYITRFLNYCKAEKIKLDVLSWHELGVDADIPSVTEHLRDARRRFVDNPTYRSLGIQRIQINECAGPSAKYRPGEILAYLDALERGGADGACRSCWGDSTGVNSCFNATLDGILTPDSREPRAAWWAYKGYADSIASRVQSHSSDRRVVSFASRETKSGSGRAQVLVGCFAIGDSSPVAGTLRVRLQGLNAIPSLGGAKGLHVRIERIPDSGEQRLTKLEVIAQETLHPVNGTAETRPFHARLHEAYLISIAAP